ncbi:MAG: hypothetical protein J6P98_06730, partial [Clostridia bacterium]|nr:hypothetical protein [Clostridia bacterium]
MEQKVVCRKSKKRAGARIRLILAALVIAAALACILFESCVRRPVLTLAGERGRALAANTMSFAVMAALEERQGDMLTVTEGEGESYLVTADTAKLNYVASLASADAQERMAELGKQGIDIPLGDVSGILLLGGRGPKLNIG